MSPRPVSAPLGRHAGLWSLVCVVLVGIASPAIARPKTDVIVLTNGDRVTGEIVSLRRGKLTLKTDSIATLDIEWDNIASISSTQRFQFEMEDGSRYTGTLEIGSSPSTIRVVTDTATADLEMARLVRITTIESGFWSRLDGSLSSGFNYTWSSGVTTFNFDAETTYRTERWEQKASLSSFITDQATGRTAQNDLSFQSRRIYRSRWFTFGLGSLQRNDQLGIEARLLAAGGAGRKIAQTNHAQFTLAGGLSVNEEKVTGGSSETNGEAIGMVSWSVYRYDFPQTDLTINVSVFPSFTVSGRVRGETQVSLSFEIFKDFYWGFSAYDSYDSKSPADEVGSNDWGVVNSFSWKF